MRGHLRDAAAEFVDVDALLEVGRGEWWSSSACSCATVVVR
ncbi:hypothetical protein [Mycolicibacterium smegmatis]|nr:hypothetical protein [Mycolicibacterium smegmatis]